MKTRKKVSLFDLLDKIEWTQIQVSRGGHRMKEDHIFISFQKSDKTKERPNRVYIRFGAAVLKALDWDDRDKIFAIFGQDDRMIFLLVKSDNGNGYKLGLESKSNAMKITFTWPFPDILLEEKSYVLEPDMYEINKKRLMFRVGEEANFDE